MHIQQAEVPLKQRVPGGEMCHAPIAISLFDCDRPHLFIRGEALQNLLNAILH